MPDSRRNSEPRGWNFLASFAPVDSCPPGRELLRQGEPARDAFLIESGLVKLSQTDEGGQECIVDVRSSGRVLEIDATLLGVPYTFTVTALTLCRVRRVRAAELRERVIADPVLSRQLHLAQSRDMLATLTLLAQVTRWSSRRRFEHLLETLSNTRPASGATLRVHLPLKQWELAQLLGITPPHLSRMLGRMEEQGALERHRGSVFLLRKVSQ